MVPRAARPAESAGKASWREQAQAAEPTGRNTERRHEWLLLWDREFSPWATPNTLVTVVLLVAVALVTNRGGVVERC